MYGLTIIPFYRVFFFFGAVNEAATVSSSKKATSVNKPPSKSVLKMFKMDQKTSKINLF